jgi:uncharacterized protein (TIGR02246 family)
MERREAAVRWAKTWVSAWRSHDVDAVVALYAMECTHLSAPFRAPHRGRDGVRAYLSGTFAEESAVIDVRFSDPLVDGHRASVEYRAEVLDRDGAPVTLAGSAFAHFDPEGLLTEVRDYWHEAREAHGPPDDTP